MKWTCLTDITYVQTMQVWGYPAEFWLDLYHGVVIVSVMAGEMTEESAVSAGARYSWRAGRRRGGKG